MHNAYSIESMWVITAVITGIISSLIAFLIAKLGGKFLEKVSKKWATRSEKAKAKREEQHEMLMVSERLREAYKIDCQMWNFLGLIIMFLSLISFSTGSSISLTDSVVSAIAGAEPKSTILLWSIGCSVMFMTSLFLIIRGFNIYYLLTKVYRELGIKQVFEVLYCPFCGEKCVKAKLENAVEDLPDKSKEKK